MVGQSLRVEMAAGDAVHTGHADFGGLPAQHHLSHIRFPDAELGQGSFEHLEFAPKILVAKLRIFWKAPQLGRTRVFKADGVRREDGQGVLNDLLSAPLCRCHQPRSYNRRKRDCNPSPSHSAPRWTSLYQSPRFCHTRSMQQPSGGRPFSVSGHFFWAMISRRPERVR